MDNAALIKHMYGRRPPISSEGKLRDSEGCRLPPLVTAVSKLTMIGRITFLRFFNVKKVVCFIYIGGGGRYN